MRNVVNCKSALVAGALIFGGSSAAEAQDTIKIGVIDQFSGPFADFGQEIGNGIDTYVREHGDTVAGKKIEILRRDQGGPDAEHAKQVAQELIVRDKVDFLAGIDFSPAAFAMAPLITEARIFLEYMGEETTTVAAGTFACRHYRFSDENAGMATKDGAHPLYDLWVTADDDAIFVKGGVGGYMQTWYELVELER